VTPRRSSGWCVERRTASASDLLDPWPPAGEDGSLAVRASRMEGRGALVLGSTQDETSVDEAAAAAAGIDLLRRTTGGGGVLVFPQAQVWLDIWVPRTGQLWADDIIEASLWLGDVWAAALAGLGAGPLVVHRGPATRAALSDLVCFTGLGPGEVRLEAASPRRTKVVGLAQRRTRRGARFHTTALVEWDPDPFLDVLHLGEFSEVRTQLRDAAIGLRALLPSRSGASDVELIDVVEDAVISALP